MAKERFPLSGIIFIILAQLFTLGCQGKSRASLQASANFPLAVEGVGYLMLADNQRNYFYSRGETFSVDKNGYWVSDEGLRLYGFNADKNGLISGILSEISLPSNDIDSIVIEEDGTIYALEDSETVVLAKVVLATFQSPYNLTSLESGIFLSNESAGGVSIGSPSSAGLGHIVVDSNQTSPADITLKLASDELFFILQNNGSVGYLSTIELFSDKDMFFTNGERFIYYLDEASDEVGSALNPFEYKSSIAPKNTTHVLVDVKLISGSENHQTISTIIYDSLGNQHELTLKFSMIEGTENDWRVVAKVNDADIGDDSDGMQPSILGETAIAQYDLIFDLDGSFNSANSDTILISNWEPRDKNGHLNGALGPQPIILGGSAEISVPSTSSNFIVEISESSTSSEIGENAGYSIEQNGYPTGWILSVSVDRCGKASASFSNGIDVDLGVIVVAKFAAPNELSLSGDGYFEETSLSGEPLLGLPCIDGYSEIVGDTIQL